MLILRKLRKLLMMAKRNKMKAKQSRSGKSPYAKYEKTPYKYSADYYNWKRSVMGGRGSAPKPIGERKKQYQMAAE